MNLWKRLFSWSCLILGGVQLCAFGLVVINAMLDKKPAPTEMYLLTAMSVVMIVLGWSSLKKTGDETGLTGKPGTYGTKNCPKCGKRIALYAQTCPKCGKAQKANDSTCSGGVNPAAQARSDFIRKRKNAKKIASPGYIWRTAGDGAVCERCAANEGREFSWDQGPPGGHAGAKARCRCHPEMIAPEE